MELLTSVTSSANTTGKAATMTERPDTPGTPSGPGAEVRDAATAVVEQAAASLRDLLERSAQRIDPFPAFPGAVFAYGIEVEPAAGADPDLGCVILGNDGRLYELQIGLDDTQGRHEGGDASTDRHEELIALDVPPATYVVYASAALDAVADYLDAGAGGTAGG